jgi:DNA-binding NtrC family response regulator
MTNRVRELETRVEGGSIPGIHGSSPVMLALLAQMKRVAGTDVSVLIRGESGSGKELVARALHTLGRRPNGPFVAINCAAVPESLQESELFGHERGAFTGATGRRVGRFEQANGGTLFLDEAGELSAALQAKLLRVLQERTFHRVGGHDEVRSDFRLVAATNRDLALDAREGRFREDLYYRMAVFELVVPSLRERGDDIVIIARVLARDLGMKVRGQPSEIPPDTAAALRAYGWPGNVRELENAIQHALVVSPGAVISPWSLPTGIAPRRPGEAQPLVPAVPASAGPAATVSRGDVSAGAPPHDREAPARVPAPGRGTDADLWESMLAGLTLEEIERRAVEAAVRRHGGNRSRAADELGIARTTLYRKLGEL